MSLVDEVKSGDERRALVAMRDALADRMAEADTNVVAQIAARLQAVIERIAALPPEVEQGDAADEIARRREARRSKAAMGSAASGKGR